MPCVLVTCNSGYRNDEHAKISVDGPGSVHFSRFSTEMGYDMLRVDQASDFPFMSCFPFAYMTMNFTNDVQHRAHK